MFAGRHSRQGHEAHSAATHDQVYSRPFTPGPLPGGRSLWIDDADWNSKVWVRLRWLSGEDIQGRISVCSLSELLVWLQSGYIPGLPHADSRAQRGTYELVWDSVVLKPESHEWLPGHIHDDTVLTVVHKVDDDQDNE